MNTTQKELYSQVIEFLRLHAEQLIETITDEQQKRQLNDKILMFYFEEEAVTGNDLTALSIQDKAEKLYIPELKELLNHLD